MTAFLIAIFVGAITVVQSVLNQKISVHIGMTSTVLLNAIVLLAVSALAFLVARTWFPASAFVSTHLPSVQQWWWIIPGITGFLIVAGFPMAVASIGAAKTFVLAVSAQIVLSAVWDIISQRGLSQYDIGAMVLAIAATVLSIWEKAK